MADTRILERFMKFVSPEPNTGCWFWTGSINYGGYGEFWLNARRWRSHRVAYELFVGPIPEGMTIDHTCHRPDECRSGDACVHRGCVNPEHLKPMLEIDNWRKGWGPLWAIKGLPRKPRKKQLTYEPEPLLPTVERPSI